MYLAILLIILFILYIVIFVFPLFKGGPYVPLRLINIERLYKLLDLPKDYLVTDLGSGDGNVLIYFAQKGFNCEGYEINKLLCLISRNKIKKLHLENKVKIFNKNFLRADLSKYNLVILYQISYIIPKIETQLLKQLKKGSIIASYCFKFKNLTPIKEENSWNIYKL